MNSRLKPLRVLLVEDSQDDADLILLELGEGGFDVVFKRVDTEPAMRDAMKAGLWDIVISDFGLPKFSASEALAILCETDMDIPFIIVSGCIGEESAITLMKEGASDFVMKHNLGRLTPVVERELRDAVARRERHQVQEALNISARLMQGVAESLGEGLLIQNECGELVKMNPEAERLLGWTEKELLGKKVFDAIYWQEEEESLPEDFCRQLFDVLANGGSYRTEGDVFVRSDGSLMPVSFVTTPIMECGKMVASVTAFQDISLRKQAEDELIMSRERLRELSAHQQSVREEERTRISRELHDELGQMLTGVKLDAKWLTTRLSSESSDVVGKIASMSRLIDETLDALRRVAAELRPVMLDDLGLEAAVEWLSEEFGKHTGIVVELDMNVENGHHGENCDLDPEVSTAAFRIVQECLTNVARHAEARHVLISLDCQNKKLTLLLSDDGKGMPATGEYKHHSYGITGMRERAHLLGGTLHMLSIPGEGTTVVAIIPVNPIGYGGALQ